MPDSLNPNSSEARLLRSALGRTSECLPIEMLESPGAETRAHLESCRYCQNELAMLMEFRSAVPASDEAASVEWIQAELARRAPASSPSPATPGIWSKAGAWFHRLFPSRAWQLVPVAAGLLFVVAGGMYLRTGEEALRPPTGDQVLRSRSFAAVSPVGDVASAPAELQWEVSSGASRYLVRVMEVDRTEIWRDEAATNRIALPASIRAQMSAGRSFLWVVVAWDATGTTVAETSLQTFHILATSR